MVCFRILGLISGSFPDVQGSFTCMTLSGWGLGNTSRKKGLQESKIYESIEQESVIILFECQNQVNQTRKAHVNNKVQDQTATRVIFVCFLP